MGSVADPERRNGETEADVTRVDSRTIPPRLGWALVIVAAFHGALLIAGSYQGTYDAYVHTFLGDHYARDWFSTWEPRWYTGFTTVSYPPGTHMAIAAVSKLTGGLGSAFVIVQLGVLLLLTVGVYRFSRIWVDERAAANAAVLLALSSSIAQTVHLFGQLPTTFALAFLLNAIPFLRRWVFGGRVRNLGAGIVTLAACTAGHHVTTLFGSIFFLGPVMVAGLLAQSRIARSGEPDLDTLAITRKTWRTLATRRVRRVLPSVGRLAILGPLVIATLVVVVLPYWLWTSSDPINQVPIPHGSRADFLADRNLGLVFFVIPWGLAILILPYALVRAVADRMWPLAASIALLFVLGTGGTTPIPRLLLGGAFDILTLDRFTFWATIMILPLAGLFVSSLEDGAIARWLRETGGPFLVRASHAVGVAALVGVALFAANLSSLRPFQPDPIDVDPVVAFIEKDQHDRWRFLTLGFGDQVAALSAATTATQVDGNYHSARRLPELTSTSVERLEGAKYRGVSGLGSLQQFLEVPERYHLKFVFSNDRFYDPLLQVLGWERLGPLENGIDVWEKADVEPLPAVLPSREVPGWQRAMWGLIPPSTIVAALFTLAGYSLRGRRRQIPIDAPEHRPNEASAVVAAIRRRLEAVPNPSVRAMRRLVLGGIAVLGTTLVLSAAGQPPDPTETVESYYDHLDFRRWDEAYAMLDPDTRPSFDLWRLQFSVRGGLVASFAKLDSIETEIVTQTEGRATVEANLQYLTSIDWHPVVAEHEVVQRGEDWFLRIEEPDLNIPPDQLVRRSTVDFAIQGRRTVTELTTDLTDIQDRPEIELRDVVLLEHNGQPVVMGMATNRDVDPADMTITAVLRDEQGATIARYNATDHLIRTLNPRESTPFRIDFQRVAAVDDVNFDPLDVRPLELTDEIASVEVYAKAVVTTQGLYRGVGVVDAEVSSGSDGVELTATLRNDGVIESIIPIVLISYLDEDGQVTWVDRRFVDESIRPQRDLDIEFVLDEPGSRSTSTIEPTVFANGLSEDRPGVETPSLTIAAPPGLDAAQIRIDVISIIGDEVVE